MATTPTQIRIDADIKKQAMDLFSSLGLDMSSAVNLPSQHGRDSDDHSQGRYSSDNRIHN